MHLLFSFYSAFFASYHYPFENKEVVEQHLPTTVGLEAKQDVPPLPPQTQITLSTWKLTPEPFMWAPMLQLHNWFDIQTILSTALFDRPSCKKVQTYGFVLPARYWYLLFFLFC